MGSGKQLVDFTTRCYLSLQRWAEVGELKKGDLEGFRVHKFTMVRQLILIAYKVESNSLVLYQAGPHENFYKNLKRYLKEIGG